MAAEKFTRVQVPTQSGTTFADSIFHTLPVSAVFTLAQYKPDIQTTIEKRSATSLCETNVDAKILPLPITKLVGSLRNVSEPVSATFASLSGRTTLSPLAQVWDPSQDQEKKKSNQLYPLGKNSEGEGFSLSDEAWIALEYGNSVDNNFDIPDDASPDLDKNTFLQSKKVKLQSGKLFVDKVLPDSSCDFAPNLDFPPSYFIDLHKKVREAGTYNFAGARIDLKHSKINVNLFRELLDGYEDVEVCQYLQYGFPLGLAQEIFLEQSLKNHQSAFTYFSYVDTLVEKEIGHCGITGPFPMEPFSPTMISPMMTAPKNPGARRPVFDASYGDWSLNENTPQKSYLGGPYNFSFPSVLDFAELVVQQGKGCLMYKRDLSRWFLQLPVDPAEYDKLGFIWRGQLWFWISFVWGTRHAGYSGQRVASAVLYIFRKYGLQKFKEPYNAMVYMDDYGGCESGEKAFTAFDDLGKLLADLGIKESKKKALSPSTKMTFLGVEFDSMDMAMRVNDTKRKEITALAKSWSRKTVASKEELQSILGKLIWISKVVRYSRCFVSRIIAAIKSLRSQKQKITLSTEVKKDLLWWTNFLDVFNGVELLVPNTVYCNILGDATLVGGGSWNESEREYFSRMFPYYLQGASIYIHIKEFWMLILAAKVWGSKWTGRRIGMYCDNEAVCKTIIYQKPQDLELQRCLREFLFHVCKFRFQPVILRVSTKDNEIADFISRVFDQPSIENMFLAKGLPGMKEVKIDDEMFNFVADW